MSVKIEVKGEKELVRNVNREIGRIKGDIHKGFIVGGDMFKRRAVALAPIEFATLRQSAFKRTFKRFNESELYIGFKAEYAPYVHEMPMKNKGKPRTGKGAKGSYWEGGENKFLEKAIKRNLRRFLEIVKRYAKR